MTDVSMPNALYAVRGVSISDGFASYVVRDKDTGELVSNEPLKYRHLIPVELGLAEAEAVAREFTQTTQGVVTWEKERVPGACPKCGRRIPAGDRDFCYPENREMTQWRAGCNEHQFGCGFEVTGDSKETVLHNWYTA